MDNASYHSRRQEKTPVTSWKKYDIQQWLSSKDISFEDNDTKAQLLEKIKNVKPQYQSYVIDEMAKEAGVEQCIKLCKYMLFNVKKINGDLTLNTRLVDKTVDSFIINVSGETSDSSSETDYSD
ncbi:unnamed protein product [Pieris macdunnoughi]|uniref:Uncharacterized protein n=1 Tax=Pieris macdunnoughi TaxID=345717 RepID=A0A821UG30_9NEOP|nr:unnamed protein product [Pieris macdunnoughi]